MKKTRRGNTASQSADTTTRHSDSDDKRLTVEEFVVRAIEKLADPGRTTIHTVYSGFNNAFRDYFPGLNPVTETEKLVKEGKVAFRFCPGGALIGKPGAIKALESSMATLKKMGL